MRHDEWRMTNGGWRTLAAALVILHSAFIIHAAPFTTRADSKKSLGPDSEKGLEKLADDGLERGGVALGEQAGVVGVAQVIMALCAGVMEARSSMLWPVGLRRASGR